MEKRNNVSNGGSQGSIESEPLFPLKGYVILNLIFWGYCFLQLMLLTWIFKDVVGLIFFFVVLGVGFTLVSAYDYIYDRVTRKGKYEESGDMKKA